MKITHHSVKSRQKLEAFINMTMHPHAEAAFWSWLDGWGGCGFPSKTLHIANLPSHESATGSSLVDERRSRALSLCSRGSKAAAQRPGQRLMSSQHPPLYHPLGTLFWPASVGWLLDRNPSTKDLTRLVWPDTIHYLLVLFKLKSIENLEWKRIPWEILMEIWWEILMGNFKRFFMTCINLICNPCIQMNVSKVSNWSNENVKTGPCCLLRVMASISWEQKWSFVTS